MKSLVAILCLLCFLSGCRVSAKDARDLDQNHRFRPTSRPVISSPVAYDFDEDGVKEIAVGSWDGYFYMLDDQLNDWSGPSAARRTGPSVSPRTGPWTLPRTGPWTLPRTGWPKYSREGYFSSPALADLDSDGVPEIIVGSETGLLFAWRADGTDANGFPVDLGYQVWASPTVLAGADGVRIAIGGLEKMFLLDARGEPVDGWPRPIHGWPDATAAYTRGKEASAPGLLAVTTLTPGDPSQGWLYAWREDGCLLPGFPLELPMDSDSSPALTEIDGDGRWWIVFGDDAGWLHVVDTSGRERPGFPVRTTGPGPGPTPTPHPPGGNVYSIEASPAVANLPVLAGPADGHSRTAIAVGSWDGRMYVWDDAGQPLPGWPIEVEDQIISSAALVDLNGDDRLDIVVGSKDHHLYGWTLEGADLPGFPYNLGHHVFSSPWVGDLEGDGRADIVVGADNGIHLLRDVGPLGREAWPMFHSDHRRTGASP